MVGNLVTVDTAGRLHTRKPFMVKLRMVVRVVDREEAALTECLLVIDATTGQNGIVQAKSFKEAVGVTGLVLAKLDGTAKGGIRGGGIKQRLSIDLVLLLRQGSRERFIAVNDREARREHYARYLEDLVRARTAG